MLELNKRYFIKPYSFIIKEEKDCFALFFSIGNSLSESKKTEEKITFKKSELGKVTDKIRSVIKNKKIKKTQDIKREFDSLSNTKKQEVDEFIDDDGTISTSKVPIINNRLSPKKTMDQTVIAVMQTNNPVTRGYRVYYGESKNDESNLVLELSPKEMGKLSNIPKTKSKINKEIDDSDMSEESKDILKKFVRITNPTDLPFELFKLRTASKITSGGSVFKFKDDVNTFIKKMLDKETISEIDYSDAFGYEETKDLDGKKTFKYLKKKMGLEPDEAKKRTEQFGKDPSGKKDKNSEYSDDEDFLFKGRLAEIQRQKMIKMVEDILAKKKDDGEIQGKDNKINKILIKNLKSIKKIAEKEGINLNQLIKILKSSE